MKQFVIGVDVGTGSARAGLFDLHGRRQATAALPIQMWQPKPDWAEQSSDNIWDAVGHVVRQVVQQSGIAPEQVIGLGFDATCSLVVLDRENQALTVSESGDNARNVIVWMDHRALAETEAINAGGYDVLRYVGGGLSPEMEIPKLVWLKSHLPQTWADAGKFLDLADFLTYQSTGVDARSLCTAVCKWTYLGKEGRWDTAFLEAVGLGDLLEGGRVGEDIRPMGEPVGPLTPAAAAHLGLTTGTIVGIGIIDAHAGGLGVLGADTGDWNNALALIGGTSSCHMAISREPRFIPGVWGPYWSAMVPGYWLTEGGQSATGALIDYTLANHAAGPELQRLAKESGQSIYEVINAEVVRLSAEAGLPHPALLTRRLHVFDGHLGNRSPLADPRAHGLVDGLSLDSSLSSLALLYLATLQSIAYGTRAILEALNAQGYEITRLYAVGGGTKNPLWLQEHADITGASIYLPEEPEAVLLGAALLGAVASGSYADIPTAMSSMCRSATVIAPNPATADYHTAKFGIYQELYTQQKARREQMKAYEG
ncbi:MAG: FGGY-family carbohydrate kinase [Janthinobacterium lividum]